jgi:bifunctional DNA-binding transcriptional regulator/antitoxin component of YhaV-PrlF toxin-antitoxin module
MAELEHTNPRVVSITSKRQFTIPKKFFDALQMGNQAKCYTAGGKLVIEPLRKDYISEQTSQILREIVAENYSGEELLEEFELRKKKLTVPDEKVWHAAAKKQMEAAYSDEDSIYDKL